VDIALFLLVFENPFLSYLRAMEGPALRVRNEHGPPLAAWCIIALFSLIFSLVASAIGSFEGRDTFAFTKAL
jgi:hypothetical protein